MTRREHINRFTVTGPITLADLRWLVAQSDGMDDDSRVEVTGRKEWDQRDVDPETITVHGTPG
jgi:hypothetical protein